MGFVICATGRTGLLVRGGVGPEATVNTTPVAV